MKAALRATAILSSGTVIKIAAGLVVVKVWAVLVGPAGVGTLGLMQSMVGLVSIVAALGIGTGVVRLGASALGREDRAEADAIAQAALASSAAAGIASALAVAVFRGALGRVLLDGPLSSGDALWLGGGVALTVMTGVQLGVLNAHQRVGALARATVWGSIGGALVGLSVLWLLRSAGLVEAYVVGIAATALASTWELARSVGRPDAAPSRVAVRAAARRLVRFGLPFTASALVGTGVTLGLPVVVLHMLDIEAVGMYRAALTVTAGYLGFLLAAMGQDYYPRLSAAGPADLGRLVNDQLRLLLLVGAPVVLGAQATAVWVVPLIYAPSFAPAVPVLEWQLTGELFRFWAWAFSFVVLARSRSTTYFATEAVGGALLLGGTWGGLQLLGLIGSGVGFMAAYVGYAALVWALVRWRTGVRVRASSLALMGAAVAASIAIHALPAVGLGGVQRPVSLALATAFALGCGWTLWGVVRRPDSAPPATHPTAAAELDEPAPVIR